MPFYINECLYLTTRFLFYSKLYVWRFLLVLPNASQTAQKIGTKVNTFMPINNLIALNDIKLRINEYYN